jgi:integrase
MKLKITAKSILKLKLPAGKSEHIDWDSEITGLGHRIRRGGGRTLIYQYAWGGKSPRLTLCDATPEAFSTIKDRDGTVVKLGIRELAAQLQAKVRLGQNPAGEKQEARKRAADTFEVIAKKFLLAKKESVRPGTFIEVQRHMLKHARPLNGMHVGAIARRDAASLLEAIKDTRGPVAANRLRSSLSDFFGWCLSTGIEGVENNPITGTTKFAEFSRDRVLKDLELREIWKHSGGGHYSAIIKLLMLTGQRANEIASLRWSEITTIIVPAKRISDTVVLPQFTIRAIELPAERCKNGRPHIIPLSEPAAAIIDAQPRRADDDGKLRDLIFGVGQMGFSGWTDSNRALNGRIAAGLGSPLDHWVVHDLRRSVSTLMNDRLGILPHVVEAILNHVSGSKRGVAGVYNKALYLRERSDALNLWADHLMSIVEGRENNVTPLRRA